jgi:hypothetical protein
MLVWIAEKSLFTIITRGAKMKIAEVLESNMLSSYMCPSCRGTGLDNHPSDDVWNDCIECEGAGEVFEDEND